MSLESGTGNSNPEQQLTIEERLDLCRDHLDYLTSDEPVARTLVSDQYILAFYKRCRQALFDDDRPQLRQLTIETLEYYPDMRPNNFANLLRCIAQDFKLRFQFTHSLIALRYPTGHQNPEAWTEFFDSIESTEASRELFRNNMRRNVQTNVPNRYVVLELALILNELDAVHIGDIGCSRNHGLKKLAMQHSIPFLRFRSPTIMNSEGNEKVIDSERSNNLGNLLRQNRITLLDSVGFDSNEIDYDGYQWGLSCMYPTEIIREPRGQVEYMVLDSLQPHSVRFHCDDVSKFDEERYMRDYPDLQKFDVIFSATTLNQLGQTDISSVLDWMKRHVKTDGMVVIADFLNFYPDGTMDFPQVWNQWTYNVYVLKMDEQDTGWQKYFTAENGRVRRIIIEPAVGRLAVARELGLADDQ